MVSDRRAFGERLKRRRERAGVTLARISQNTKIPVALFTGLEAGDCSRWPTGLFARAYVRGYAEAIGLNGDETVEEFVAAFGAIGHAEGVEAPPAPSAKTPPLRLSMAEEPVEPAALARRAGLAATELLIGALIAALAYVGLQTNVWTTVGLVLTYFTLGRLISDDPLLYWIFKRARRQPEPAPLLPSESESADVSAVGETASTTFAHL
jgi:transcriptional regulator with XRE-family HTH domain